MMKISRIKSIFKICTNPSYRFISLGQKGYYNNLSDDEYIHRMFKAKLGYFPNLSNPQTFNEKLQWLKLHDHNPEYTIMVDKYAVKKWVADRIGEEYIIPTLGVWEHFDDINFDTLPNQFVLKCTHDSGGLVIVKDKSTLDKKSAKRKIEKCLKRNYYWVCREWPYKNVPPRIIAEQYMSNCSIAAIPENIKIGICDEGKLNAFQEIEEGLTDYKFMCFNGVPKIIEIHKGRFTEKHTQDFYDISWKPSGIKQGPVSERPIERPINYEKMIEFSRVLSMGLIHVRIDWYEVNGKLYFGEITFYDGAGFDSFDDLNSEIVLGNMIHLPNKKQGE